MAKHETRSLNNLDLSWPHSVNYHVDIARSELSSPGTEYKAKSTDTGSQKPQTKYNRVPGEVLGDAQTLIGDEIRVLDLKKGTHEMPLEGSLRKVRLSDHPVFEPLSYTWGDYDTVQPSDAKAEYEVHAALFLWGTKNYLDLTSNCAKALYRVRKPTTDRTIWVDSICVNQDDTDERSHQVDMMKEIYARAFTVLVYLGGESADDGRSSDLAMSLLGQPDRLKNPHQLDECETTSLKRLFGRPYFRRMWIVQEVALAKTIEFHCGSATTYVSKFAGNPLEAIIGSQVAPPWLRHSKQTVIKLPRRPTTSQAYQILSLIFDTALCDCKDDRDRIFALFSLLNPSHKERLRADYNLSTAQVYAGIATYLARNGFLWGVLMLAPRLAPNNCPGLPSWVPQWNSISRAGLESLPISELMLSPGLGIGHMFRVPSSGVITIRGMLLGSVTNSGYSSNFKLDRHELKESVEQARRLFVTKEEADDPSWQYPETFPWKLTKSPQAKSLDSWECDFHFFTPSKGPKMVEHRVFMLSDYLTVLILKPHDRIRDQYTLVETGMPLVRATLPDDCQADRHTPREISLHSLRPLFDRTQPYWNTILSSKDMFPQLSGFPELWRHNPITSSMTLTHTAIQGIQCIDMSELDLLKRWQKHACAGIQVLRDKTQLRHLIDEVNGLRHDDYMQIGKAAGFDHGWSLDHFLGLFIRNPFQKEPMMWPDVQLHGDQPMEEIAVLPQLMQWAQLTYRFLMLLRDEDSPTYDWPGLLMDSTLHFIAMAAARFQLSVASADCTIDTSCCLDRTSVLLEKILDQVSDGSAEQIEGPCFINERYWDWRSFNPVMQQRLSILGHVQRDVEKIQADLHDFEPDFGVITAHEVFAAHGIDTREAEFTKIQIR